MKNTIYVFTLILFAVINSQTQAAQTQMPTCISKHFGGASIPADRIDLIAPNIAESGAVVSVGIQKVRSVPKDRYVKEIIFYNEFREEPVATFSLSKQVPSTNLKTRIRLRASSNLYAVARLDNGKLIGGKSFIKVTIGGCGGGGSENAITPARKVCTK